MKEARNQRPPSKSKNVLTDIRKFLINKPDISTLIKFDTREERDFYNERVMQRIGIDPDRYSVLNIHKIGVEAPASYVFNELLEWNGDSTCWPNHIAKVDLIENDLKRVSILPFGWRRYPIRPMKSIFGFKLIPLFLLDAIRIKKVPDTFDFDNARYLLYECSGGYPIGIYVMYTRSSIAEMNEEEKSQLIFAVGFNFYGKRDWQKRRKLVNKVWELVHNRVTNNVLYRMKRLAEWRMEQICNR